MRSSDTGRRASAAIDAQYPTVATVKNRPAKTPPTDPSTAPDEATIWMINTTFAVTMTEVRMCVSRSAFGESAMTPTTRSEPQNLTSG